MSAYDDLTPKQKRFVDAYLETGNASRAARLAGYVGSSATIAQQGWQTLQKIDVKAAIKERGGNTEKKRIASAEEVLEILTAIARDGYGEDNRVRACELLGKRYGTWIDRHEVKQVGNFPAFVEAALAKGRQQAAFEFDRNRTIESTRGAALPDKSGPDQPTDSPPDKKTN